MRMFDGENYDFHDERYMRRLKRKRIDQPSRVVTEEEDTDCGEIDNWDPEYKIFMEKVREEGKSYKLEVTGNNGSVEFIMYEAEGGLKDKCETQSQRKLNHFVDKDESKALKNSQNVQKKYEVENLEILSGLGKEKSDSIQAKDLRSESESHCIFDIENSMDDCYRLFLNSVKIQGYSVVFSMKNGKTLTYDWDDVENPPDSEILDDASCKPLMYADDVESSSDLRILEMDEALFCEEGNYTPFVPSRGYDASMLGDDGQCLGNPGSNNQMQFRDKVMGILKKPFDQKEFDWLSQFVREQLPVEGQKHLRGRTKSYAADRRAKSYLERHSDLEQKVKGSQHDRHKLLNILRGFKYWLMNLSHEGAFKPWQDSSCLAVMPGSGQ